MKQVALFLFLLLMISGIVGIAERQVGDYIYVPAGGTIQVTDVIHLTVEGVGYAADTGESRREESLSGAEFGVYVINAAGEVRPWANPLYPTEQMKIRTGVDGASFTLPSGMEYYLMQQSTQNGYLFDADALIPVNSRELTVQNVMPSLLAVSACDSLNTPIAGVVITVTDEDGKKTEQMTDEYGWARFYSDSILSGTVTETKLMEDAVPARSVTINGVRSDSTAFVTHPGECTVIRFEHPASGTVQLNTTVTTLGDSGETLTQPLPGVTMTIESNPAVTLTADEAGYAETVLLEGTYPVTFSAPNEQVHMPFEKGSLVIESGGVTNVLVEASMHEGRIVLDADFGGHNAKGTVTILSETDGTVAAFLELPADGHLVSPSLAAGNYWVRLESGEQTRLGRLRSEQMTAEEDGAVCLEVKPGSLTILKAEVAVPETQQYSLAFKSLNEYGETEIDDLRLTGTGILLREDGSEECRIQIENGELTVNTFTGAYFLVVDEQQAETAGIRNKSEVFELPSQDGTILFPTAGGRVMLSASDINENPVAEGTYRITDAAGKQTIVTTDGNGLVVSDILARGTAKIECMDLPFGFESAPPVQTMIEDGVLTLAELVHPRKGTLKLAVFRQTIEKGKIVHTPMEEIGIQLRSLSGILPEYVEYRYTNENGVIESVLPEGEYEASFIAGELQTGETAGEPISFTVKNDTETDTELVYYASEGGIEVSVTSQDAVNAMILMQMQFELTGEVSPIALRLEDGVFKADGLPAGTYTLTETQAPAGYSLMHARKVQIAGGQISGITVPLVEYAAVQVKKYGLTFDDQMKNYLIPLKGRYGVFVKDGDELIPYPDEVHQAVVYSNVPAESDLPSIVQLPAEEEGSVYVLMELDASTGFEKDAEQHEITVRPGDETEITGSVSSDRGFYHVTLRDAQSGESISGAQFTLSDSEGNVLDTFELNGTYRNEMAIPVGEYVLKETRAASGYFLTEVEKAFHVEPYLSMGGQVTELEFDTMRIPEENWGSDLFSSITASAGQKFTLLTVDPASLPPMIGLAVPQITIQLSGISGDSAGIRTVSLTGAENGTQNTDIRIEYAAAGCGWLMSRSQIVKAAELPKNVVFPDEESVYAVRLTYLNPDTGLEQCDPGFMPGDVILEIENYTEQSLNIDAGAFFSGTLMYRTEEDQPLQRIQLHSEQATVFTAVSSGISAPVLMGRDGRISGKVFYDRNADGILASDEKGIPAVSVVLCDLSGNEIEQTQTDTEGCYVFSALSAGQYTLHFDESRLYTRGTVYSDYLCSHMSVSGISDPVSIDSGHTDAWIIAGAVDPAALSGAIVEQVSKDQYIPVEGWSVELFHVGDDEPVIIWSSENGAFSSNRLLPGEYELRIRLPENDLSRETENGNYVKKKITVSEGETLEIPTIVFKRAASIMGTVRVDEDGDGKLSENSETVKGIRVELSEVEADGHAEPVGVTVTEADGRYRFDGLFEGSYVVSFLLDDPWVFTQYGADSDVFGSVSASGSTKAFQIDCGSENVRNAGVTLPSRFSVTVFCDKRMDGIRGGDEPGLSDVRISLVRIEGETDGEIVSGYTDENGTAVFERVSPGRYAVLYQMPGIWRTTVMPQTTGNETGSFVPQSTQAEGRSGTFMIPMGAALDLSIGAVQTGEISGSAYYDDNADAAVSESEPSAEGILVTLLNAEGEPVQETVTGPDGSYAFVGLPQGRYFVRFTARDGECFSGNERTASRGTAERSDESVSQTRVIILEGGRTVTTANAGIVRPSRIIGNIFIDRNADSVRGTDERPLSSAKISLTNASGRTLISTIETDEEGAFVFERVYPGHYKLRIDAGDGYVYSGNADGNALPIESQSGNWVYTAEFVIYGNTTVDNLSYGFLSQGVIAGIVWEDSAYSGEYAGRNGLRYVTVNLINGDGKPCGSEKTDREGQFRFEKLMPGEYTLEITLESGYVFTVNGKDSAAPRLNAGTCTIPLGYLEMGEIRDDLKIGALKPGSVTGYVWYDTDNDGRRQIDSVPLADIPVTLRILSGPDSGNVQEVITDESGRYRFDAVMPGTFVLSAALPEKMAFTQNRNGQKRVSIISQTDDNTGDSATMTMESGLNLQDVDIGAVEIGSIEGSAWTDTVYDGVQGSGDNPLAGVTVTLLDSVTGGVVRQTRTDEDGHYRLERLRTGDYRLRFDLPESMIFTKNGNSVIPMLDSSTGETDSFHLDMGGTLSGFDVGAIIPAVIDGMVADEDSGSGCSGIMVSLMDGGTAGKTTETNSKGQYHFDTVRPGRYRLRFSIDEKHLFALTIPLNLTDADAREGETDAVDLPMGEHILVDPILLVRCSEIDGRAWLDVNVDGHMDTGEKTLSGVRLTLVEADSKKTVAVAETEEDGKFVMSDLRKGKYILEAELPEEMLFTDYTGNMLDSCMEPTENNLSESKPFDIASGETVKMNIGGIIPGIIGDTVWIDLDENGLQDYMELQQSGVGITLLMVGEDGTETEIISASSDMYGYYHFDGLRPGRYRIRVDDELSFTRQYDGSLGEIDSDILPDTGMSEVFLLQSGERKLNVDIGILPQ